MSYLQFTSSGQSASGKTSIWRVLGGGHNLLGEIKWYGPWRRYVFHPIPGTLYDGTCMVEIAQALIDKTAEHKQMRASHGHTS